MVFQSAFTQTPTVLTVGSGKMFRFVQIISLISLSLFQYAFGNMVYNPIPTWFKNAAIVCKARLIKADSFNLNADGKFQYCVWKMKNIRTFKNVDNNGVVRDTIVIFGVRKDSILCEYKNTTSDVEFEAQVIESMENVYIFLYEVGTINPYTYYLIGASPITSNNKKTLKNCCMRKIKKINKYLVL
jgi:hypothetical protein